MGNYQTCQSCETAWEEPGELIPKKSLPHIENKAIAPNKVNFQYLHPLKKQDTDYTEDNLPIDPIEIQGKKVSFNLSESIKPSELVEEKQEEESPALKKTIVNWNEFVKVKNKDYLTDYLVLREIGRGAYGAVFKVKQRDSNLLRAAKTISKKSLLKNDSCGRLFSEVAIPTKLDHPNIIKFFQVYQYKSKLTLISELCEGGDLYHRIKSTRSFSEAGAAKIMSQILSAVRYMHQCGIVHRDLKPENILYNTETEVLKIIDFGSASRVGQGGLKDLIGTSFYIAPQVINRQYGFGCDVWSCGIILFIILCGYPPFNGKDDNQIFHAICHQKLEFKGNVWQRRSTSVKDLLTKMLVKDPNRRCTIEQVLHHPWISNTPTIEPSSSDYNEITDNLKRFYFKSKLKAVVLTYIASQLYSSGDKQKLRKAFKSFDIDGDGTLCQEELKAALAKEGSDSKGAKNNIARIFNQADTNESGKIDFTEFLVAASPEESLVSGDRLENVFRYLDNDRSGLVSMEEVRAFLDNTQQTCEEVKATFKEADENGDGFLTMEEFIRLLTKTEG